MWASRTKPLAQLGRRPFVLKVHRPSQHIDQCLTRFRTRTATHQRRRSVHIGLHDPPKQQPTLGLLDPLQRPPIARSSPLGSIHLLCLPPALDRRLRRDLARVERHHPARIQVAGKDHHGSAGRTSWRPMWLVPSRILLVEVRSATEENIHRFRRVRE